ncbi:MAG: hypothetical protein HYW50_00410 [Candidatus Diapherotrites archaeon]|nr:hypothetical protein [Candidatus Diapherotrites archaeon]
MKKFFVLFAVLLISSFAGFAGALEVKESFLLPQDADTPFKMSVSQSHYSRGQIAEIEFFETVNRNCQSLELNLALKNSSGETVETTSKVFGNLFF